VQTAKKITKQTVMSAVSQKSSKDIKNINKKLVKKHQACKMSQLQVAQILDSDLIK
jgi:hypothetical protein